MARRSHARSTAWWQGERAETAAPLGSRQDNSTLFHNTRGRVVGRLSGGWLRKSVDTTRHQLRFPPAWAVDTDHLARLRQSGALGVELTDEKGCVWTATLGVFDAHGEPTDRGHGPQVLLRLPYWRVVRPGQAVQMSFFSEME